MKSLLDPTDMDSILRRLSRLQAKSNRQWGKMNPSQMLSHCSAVLESATGVKPVKQKLLGKIITPFIRSTVLGEKPFGKNAPTDPSFVMSDEHDFEKEKARLQGLLARFSEVGPEKLGEAEHIFFGKLTGEEWGRLSYKHLDHHFRQFGV
ncbi:MAG: DUF1569 domain-containing protein [Acidobacteria bacterium]|nr:DUF1569 domain-containing protein [Acidobacteriota bacterium]MCK6680794.1 DUF1569 domain-containing protein [Thermoanaerobaculia bacterium]